VEDKIWFSIENRMPYGDLEGVTKVTKSNFPQFINQIEESIIAFSREVEWDNMWDIKETKNRFNSNQVLFLLRDETGALGHVWFDEDYLYNMFVSDRREAGVSVKFILHCFNYIPYKDIRLYCDKWNKKAQKFFEKVGAKKISSYL
jgi:hypothetical protein